MIQFSSVQLLSRVQPFETPWTAACQTFLSITNSQGLLKLLSIESGMPSNHLCRPLLLQPSIFPSIRVFPVSQFFELGNQVAKIFNLQHQPFQYSGLISLRMDWLDFLAVSQESYPTPQFKSINSLVPSFLNDLILTSVHMTTGKTTALTRWTFVGKVISLLF